jgi:AAA domain
VDRQNELLMQTDFEWQSPEPDPHPERMLNIVTLDDVPDETVSWFWQPSGNKWIPADGLTMCAGKGGTGKSSFSLWLAAELTRGQLEGMYYGKPSNVLIYASEDSIGIIKSRIKEAGADLTRVSAIHGMVNEEHELSWSEDMPLIEDAIRQHDIRMLIVDPILDAIDGDSDKNQATSRALIRFVNLAQSTSTTVIGIGHTRKNVDDVDAMINGSVAFRNKCRAVILFAINKKTGEHVMDLNKHNYGPDQDAMQYSIDSHDPITGIPVFQLWGPSVGTIEDALISDVIKKGKSDDDIEPDERLEWLSILLADGAKTYQQCADAASMLGYKWDTVTRWIKSAGGPKVFSKSKGGPGTPWMWSLTDLGRKLYQV